MNCKHQTVFRFLLNIVFLSTKPFCASLNLYAMFTGKSGGTHRILVRVASSMAMCLAHNDELMDRLNWIFDEHVCGSK
jgi:hypothetical protein